MTVEHLIQLLKGHHPKKEVLLSFVCGDETFLTEVRVPTAEEGKRLKAEGIKPSSIIILK